MTTEEHLQAQVDQALAAQAQADARAARLDQTLGVLVSMYQQIVASQGELAAVRAHIAALEAKLDEPAPDA